jgi:hypothetical protein
VLQIRAYIRDTFLEVADYGFLSKESAKKVKMPASLRETGTTTLTWERLRLALSRIPGHKG